MVGVVNKTNSKENSNFHSKVKVALALLLMMMVACPPSMLQPSCAEEPKATTSASGSSKDKPDEKQDSKFKSSQDDETSSESENKSEAKAENSEKKAETSDSAIDKKSIEDIGQNPVAKPSTKDLESGFTLLENTAAAEDDAFQQIYDNPILSQNEAVDHFECARFYMSKWDTELAEVELRAAIMYMPNMKVAHRDYCLVALMRGKPLRALAEFMMVIGLGEAIPLSESQRKELREDASGAHYNKGLKYAEDSKWEDAISELLWSRKYTPLDPAVHRSLAFAYASNKEFDKAEEQYNYTLSLNPSDALAHADYAVLLSEKGKPDQALALMNKAVQLKPKSTALHVDLGWMAESKGDLKTAASQFEYAVKASPEHSVLWTHLGNVYKKLGKNDNAILAYSKALELDPNLIEVKTSLEALKVNKTEAGTGDDALKDKANSTITNDNTTGGGTTPLKPKPGITPLKK